MKKKYDIITIGAAVHDSFFFLDRHDVVIVDNPRREQTRKKLMGLEYGAKISAHKTVHAFGGGALNSAITFARAGLKTAACIGIGDDESGAGIKKICRTEEIHAGFIATHKTLPTGVSALLVAGDAHEHVAITDRGASNVLCFIDDAKLYTQTAWLYTTALGGDAWQHDLDTIAHTVKMHGIRWAWNPGSAQLAQGLGGLGRYIKACDVLLVNRDEAIELVKSDSRERTIDESVEALLESLQNWGARIVVITDGSKGVYARYAGTVYYAHTIASSPVIETTGAGDACGSGFVSVLARSEDVDIEHALDTGITNAESVIAHIGAQRGILSVADFQNAYANRTHTVEVRA